MLSLALAGVVCVVSPLWARSGCMCSGFVCVCVLSALCVWLVTPAPSTVCVAALQRRPGAVSCCQQGLLVCRSSVYA